MECSPMAWETGVQSQVESYQRLKTWYLIPPSLKLSFIRYKSRIKWSNPRKDVVAIEKGDLGSPSTMVINFTYFIITKNMQTLVKMFIQYKNNFLNLSHCFPTRFVLLQKEGRLQQLWWWKSFHSWVFRPNFKNLL